MMVSPILALAISVASPAVARDGTNGSVTCPGQPPMLKRCPKQPPMMRERAARQ